MGQTINIKNMIEIERSALYACVKVKCRECPLKGENDCMVTKLKIFNKIIEGLENGKTLHK